MILPPNGTTYATGTFLLLLYLQRGSLIDLALAVLFMAVSLAIETIHIKTYGILRYERDILAGVMSFLEPDHEPQTD